MQWRLLIVTLTDFIHSYSQDFQGNIPLLRLLAVSLK